MPHQRAAAERALTTAVLMAAACLPATLGCDYVAPAPARLSRSGQSKPPADSTNPAKQPMAVLSSNDQPQAKIRAADGDDDPRRPAYLPRSHDVADWVRTEPVRVAVGGVRPLLSEVEAASCAGFKIARCIRCTFENAAGARVAVLAIETQEAADAFGLASVRASGAAGPRLGGRTRVDTGTPQTVHVWQGRVYLQFRIERAGIESPDVQALAARIVGNIPGENPPRLLAALPESDDDGAWLVRSLASLAPAARESMGLTDPAAADELLGLAGGGLLCGRGYVAPGGAACMTWVVEHDSDRSARDAYERITRAIDSGDPRYAAWSVLPPQKQFLIGTFTAEEESLLRVMPRIAMRLPN